MADPLSVAASAAGLISLAIQVTQSIVDFYNTAMNQDSDITRMTKRLASLLTTFKSLERILSDRRSHNDEKDLVYSIEASIKDCDESIHDLQDECERFKKASPAGLASAVRGVGRRATYPFRKSTLQRLDENIGEMRANLSSALSVLQLKDMTRSQEEIAEVKLVLDLVRMNQLSSTLRDWLRAPDASTNHDAACQKKHPGTGVWLLKDVRFLSWLTENNSLIWLNGFAGTGKSVLCSTAIQSVLRRPAASIGIAFFYFTFTDESKQDESAMLRALLLQLSNQLDDGFSDLTQLHDSCKSSTPPVRVLLEYLRRVVWRFQHVYIFLDALDECPQDRARGYVLDALETMRSWGLQGLHLFVTSRDAPDIRDSLETFSTCQIRMQNIGIDKDVADYVSGRLDTDRRLRKLLPYRSKVQASLAARANGM